MAIFFNEREDHLIDLLPAIELGERSGGFGCRIEDAAAARSRWNIVLGASRSMACEAPYVFACAGFES